MLSNKLTFSLVLVLMLTLVAGSAFAQVNEELDNANTPGKGMFTVIGENAGGTTNTGIGTDYGALNGIGMLDPAVFDGDLPDLANLLGPGGTIELAIVVATGTAPTDGTVPTNTVFSDTSDDDIAALKHKMVISEIMWGQNLSATGTDPDTMDAAQWIEIYNHNIEKRGSDTLALIFTVGISPREVGMKYTTPAELTGDWVILDQVSTNGRFGRWNPKGQSGNTERIGALIEPNAIPPTNLVSMYRAMALKDDGSGYKDKDGLPQDLKDGNEADAWAESAGSTQMRGYFVGSPGSVHVTATGTAVSIAKAPSTVTGKVLINEVRNDDTEANLDWVEFYHLNDAEDATAQNVDAYELSVVTAFDKDEKLFDLPKYKLKPNEYLVIYNRDPGETILAGGVNVEDVAAGKQVNKGASHLYAVRDFNIPDTGKLLLILRSESALKKADKVVDFAGNGFVERREGTYNTDVWPFQGWTKPDAENVGDNSFTGDSWGRTAALNDKGVYRPKVRDTVRTHNEDWQSFGNMGGAGYDRDTDPNSTPGTPGYANVAINIISDDRDNVKSEDDYAFTDMITISEVMYDARHPRDLVQWIELYNNSSDTVVNIAGWRMEIRNIADGKVESYVDSGFDFADNTEILPNQTLLLVSRTGPSSVPRTRVYDLNQRHRVELGLQRRDKVLLSSEGFYIELEAKVNVGGASKMMSMDMAGNLMVDGATRTKQWDLPAADDEGARTSIVRQYDAGAADPGDMEDSWKVSEFGGLAYYGHRDDVGTPGYRRGGPLPVSLSSFRPVRNQTTGHVDIKWVTESELNNAGFNILRAEGKDGEFTVINLQGIIAGHGTTSEKHVYTFTDKTAKPNVVYYYQIEDVSLNGNRTTLATTHMRGNVSAAGKVTTTWGDLKFQK